MNNLYKLFALLLIITSGFTLSSCKEENKNEILIGEFASLTGSEATFGQSSHNGLMLTVEEINGSGGVLGKQIKLITDDTQSKTQ